MATNISGFPRSYSLSPGGLQNIPPFVINTNRAPATSDRANLGTLWNYINNNSVWMLTSATGGNYNWTPLTNNIGVISRLQAADGTIALPVAGLVAFPNTVITANTNPVTNILTSVQANNSNNFLINLAPEIQLRSQQNDVLTVQSVTNNDLPLGINLFKAKGTVAAPLPVVATTNLVNITQYGFDGTVDTIGSSIKSRVPAGGVVGANCVEAELVFSTSGSTAGVPPSILNERVIIGKDGLVTINTPTENGAALTVNGVNTAAQPSLVIEATVNGLHNAIQAFNLDNVNAASCEIAVITASQDGAGGRNGDSQVRFTSTIPLAPGTVEFTIGKDASANDFVISQGPSLGTTNRLTIDGATGAVNLPAQPSFCAVIAAASAAGVTGNGTNYVLGSNAEATPTVYTKLYESTPNIVDAQGRFIAPVAGRYLFTAGVRMSAYAGVTNAQIQILAPFGVLVGSETCPPAALTAFFSINTSGVINLAQGQPVSVRINCNGQGANNTVVQGDGVNLLSYFTGALLN